MIDREEKIKREKENEREERERENQREKYMERERVHKERVCTGGRGFESETRGSQTRELRRAEATNAGLETCV